MDILTIDKAVMLLTAINSVKFHLMQPLHTPFQGVLAVRASDLRLHFFSLTDSPEANHFHSFSALRFLIYIGVRVEQTLV